MMVESWLIMLEPKSRISTDVGRLETRDELLLLLIPVAPPSS